jgi:hypothetical protein
MHTNWVGGWKLHVNKFPMTTVVSPTRREQQVAGERALHTKKPTTGKPFLD